MTISRTGGDLVSRSLFYSMSGEGNSQFFGSTGILTFNSGENEKTIVIIASDDNIPEVSVNNSHNFYNMNLNYYLYIIISTF